MIYTNAIQHITNHTAVLLHCDFPQQSPIILMLPQVAEGKGSDSFADVYSILSSLVMKYPFMMKEERTNCVVGTVPNFSRISNCLCTAMHPIKPTAVYSV